MTSDAELDEFTREPNCLRTPGDPCFRCWGCEATRMLLEYKQLRENYEKVTAQLAYATAEHNIYVATIVELVSFEMAVKINQAVQTKIELMGLTE